MWAHAACAMWIPECGFKTPSKPDVIVGIDSIDRLRWKLKCELCFVAKGACIQCMGPACISEGTNISLSAGFSRPIQQLHSMPELLSYVKDDGIHNLPSINFENKGISDCIQLTLEDGRTLTCTPDHRILSVHHTTHRYYRKQLSENHQLLVARSPDSASPSHRDRT